MKITLPKPFLSKPHDSKLGDLRVERHPYGGKGLFVTLQILSGSGYLADFPFGVRLRGRTVSFGTHVKVGHPYDWSPRKGSRLFGRKGGYARAYVGLGCNQHVHPGWW